jgi:hypothetical protein
MKHPARGVTIMSPFLLILKNQKPFLPLKARITLQLNVSRMIFASTVAITDVSRDMSPAFFKGVEENFTYPTLKSPLTNSMF